jgi:hypothetical protein
MIKLGHMNREQDLRKVWEVEDRNFTPWLAEQGLELLGDTIGIDLELNSQEQNVGPFKADVLCKDTATDKWVLIENQIEKTDHTHLGQILTYGAGLEATTIVWIAKQFTEEHRAALDWLNEITDERFNFFGLEIELWQIDNSPIAPKFNIVCKPNDWIVGRSSTMTIRTEITPDQQLKFDYWTAFVDYLSERDSTLKTGKPMAWSFCQISIGRSGFRLLAYLNLKDDAITAGLYLQGPNTLSYYGLLKQERRAIEDELGTQLFWDESKQTTRYINITKNYVNIRDRQSWSDQHKWLYEQLEAFRRAFGKRVKNLDAGNYQPEEDLESINEST